MADQPAATEPRAAGPTWANSDYDLLDALSARFEQLIHDEAATWEVDFDAGPGAVVGVPDAARVIARHVLGKPEHVRVGPAEETAGA